MRYIDLKKTQFDLPRSGDRVQFKVHKKLVSGIVLDFYKHFMTVKLDKNKTQTSIAYRDIITGDANLSILEKCNPNLKPLALCHTSFK